MSLESSLWKKKNKLSADEAYKYKKRCWTCRNYILNRDTSGTCTKYGRLTTDVSNEECPFDGSGKC